MQLNADSRASGLACAFMLLPLQVRTGGKGTVRRKKKAVHKTASTDDKRLQVRIRTCCTCTYAQDIMKLCTLHRGGLIIVAHSQGVVSVVFDVRAPHGKNSNQKYKTEHAAHRLADNPTYLSEHAEAPWRQSHSRYRRSKFLPRGRECDTFQESEAGAGIHWCEHLRHQVNGPEKACVYMPL